MIKQIPQNLKQNQLCPTSTEKNQTKMTKIKATDSNQNKNPKKKDLKKKKNLKKSNNFKKKKRKIIFFDKEIVGFFVFNL